MTIEESKKVDAIGIRPDSGEVVLTIVDHLSWQDSQRAHLLLLQDKINSYLSFIESGELFESYPEARGRQVAIHVVGKYTLSGDAEFFFQEAASVVRKVGVNLTFELFQATA